MNRTRATELAGIIRDQLAAAGITPAAATLDSTDAGGELEAGAAVVIVQPPRVTYDTYDQASAEWELIATAGPPHAPYDAWETLDGIAGALRLPLDVDSTEPAAFQPQQGSAYPALLIRFTEHYNIT